ncbi:proteasome subunit alpha type-5-like [Octopus sinensis]|uniref:Proteasome subunit alpha type-5-like n=1 Tax=Octopus sinensis TaxID=2607531 RepID=A0A6P7U1M1_9MOLL|nr:proteasome subunit alpha type-5-like [Octopus sinensis]
MTLFRKMCAYQGEYDRGVSTFSPEGRIYQIEYAIEFHLDPSGNYIEYNAVSIGAGSDGAKEYLIENYNAELSLADSTTMAIRVLKQVMQESISDTNIETSDIFGS